MMLDAVHIFTCHQQIFFEKCSKHLPFSFFSSCVESYLFIFEYKSFFRYKIFKYFLSACDWVFFVLLTVSFEKQKFFILMKSNLLFFILWIVLLIPNLRNFDLTQGTEISSYALF